MLKWAVNGPIRQTYLPTLDKEKCQITDSTITLTPNSNTKKLVKRPLKRKCSSTNDNHIKVARHNKCNNRYTSTPLTQKYPQYGDEQQYSAKRQSADLLRTVNSDGKVKDLSNITGKTTQKVTTLEKSTDPLKTLPTSYASTLPTIEFEYSPCNNIIPGPILALRGIGLRDNYFEKPRYLNSNKNEQESSTKLINATSNISNFIKSSTTLTSCVNYEDSEESLSSSKVGDATLERMIDAILESTRKDRKFQKSMSPTYTPANDPANDLLEFLDKHQKPSIRYCERHSNHAPCQQLESCLQQYSHQYVSMQSNRSMLLRRQRAIRRKRKINQLTLNTLTTADQQLSKNKPAIDNLSIEEKQTPRAELEKESTENQSANENKNQSEKILENINENAINLDNILYKISPDSGHNSASDEDDDKEKENAPANDINKKMRTHYHSSFDITKRRLSFSIDTF